MQYLYTDITVSPYSEMACDVLSAMLNDIGFDSFEMTDTGIKAYIPQNLFDENLFEATLAEIVLPDVSFSYTLRTLENKDWNAEWEQNSFDPILEREFGIRLNPRMAFGSGSHATTYQITSLLFKQDFTLQRVLDMGTGTGVL
ncbi:MAG: 50S ribosomal protein L11 methyltransferase, partial [Bacteroidaceae bacterium]|nr:50S ribosomal protein L11 methyltransferase [Bacteroidaceae bacterium]